jgi:RND superfamily putative drug exporter
VSMGLERTGGVITGAAAIMIVIFAAFILSPIIMVKELGFGLAVAVLLDATLVRVILVPATMKLFGEWNWWLPAPLAKVLPKVELERDGVVPVSDCGCRPAGCRCGGSPCTCDSPSSAPARGLGKAQPRC